jgi:hypothetical protein
MDPTVYQLERKLSALKLIWKIIIIIGTVISLTVGALYPRSTTALIVLLFLWGGLTGLIVYIFHKIKMVKLQLQSTFAPPEPVQVIYTQTPTYYARPYEEKI